jgi:outer membrane murein-binding lipoprotein Lpp
MDDYYSLLGIDADASVDDIRGAYRVRKDGLDTASDAGKADAAKLNKAWNVLSDPYQRGRYDEQRELTGEDGLLDADVAGAGDSVATTNGSTSTGATGKGLRNSARNSRQARAQSTRELREARTKAATLALPPGTKFPAPKQRIIAMVIDLLVIIVLVSGAQILASHVAKSQKPDVVHRVDNLNDQITQNSKDKSAADKLVSADKKANNTAQQAIDQKKSDDLKAQGKNLTTQRDDEVSKLNPYYLGSVIIAFILGFLYLAVPSALTGRTLGKRTQHLKTLREDGSPLGWRGAITRFGLVVLVTFVLYLLLQQIAGVVVLFGVTMWMRNGNMQGLHDRFAHTIVVTDVAD